LKHLILFILLCAATFSGFAQQDSTGRDFPSSGAAIEPKKPVATPVTSDSIAVVSDSLSTDSAALKTGAPINLVDTFYKKLLDNPYLQMKQPPVYLVIKERVHESKDEVFYLAAGLLLFLGFIKLLFSRYFSNIFRLFFQPSFRQKQTREQLQQSNLPSLLLNLFFILSGGIYLALLADYHQVIGVSFWLQFVYSTALLMSLYAGKYVFISFAGWVFNVKEASETYMFVVYLINKILGVALIPFILLIAFSQPSVIPVAITVSVLLISVLFMYRYVVSYGPVRKEVRVSPLHFLFYVLAFEITPLLLIYKSLLIYLNKSI
jgi:hypothetical protein